MSKKLTPWFPGNIAPARDGVYKLTGGDWARFENGVWLMMAGTVADAAAETVQSMYPAPSDRQPEAWKWRGLAEEPK